MDPCTSCVVHAYIHLHASGALILDPCTSCVAQASAHALRRRGRRGAHRRQQAAEQSREADVTHAGATAATRRLCFGLTLDGGAAGAQLPLSAILPGSVGPFDTTGVAVLDETLEARAVRRRRTVRGEKIERGAPCVRADGMCRSAMYVGKIWTLCLDREGKAEALMLAHGSHTLMTSYVRFDRPAPRWSWARGQIARGPRRGT